MNCRKILTIIASLMICSSCNTFDPKDYVAEIEDAIRFKEAIATLRKKWYIEPRRMGNLLTRIEQQNYETYWKRMNYIKLFKIEEYFPKKDEDFYRHTLDLLMDTYRDTEIMLGPIEKNYRDGVNTYYTVEDRLSGMKYYIRYRRKAIWTKKGTLDITSKKEKINGMSNW